MKKAVEPDDCFYIQHFERVLGKSRIGLSIDPPPELAIEVDLTSKTQLEAYEGLGVLELWRYDARKLRIDSLKQDKYVEVAQSPSFPSWLTKRSIELSNYRTIEQSINRAMAVGQGKANKEFRQWVVESIENSP